MGMTGAEPTHQAIIAEVAELKQLSRERDARVKDVQKAVGVVHDKLTAGEVRFARIDERQVHQNSILVEIRDTINKAVVDGHDAMDRERARIAALEKAALVTETQFGVWKAIINSKPALWLWSILTAAGAWFLGANTGGGQ